MHKTAPIVRFNAEQGQDESDEDLELQEKKSYVQVSTPQELSGRRVSASSLLEKSDGRMSHLRVALEFGEEITEEQLREPYKGTKNTLSYMALRIAIIALMVIISVAAQDKFLDLEDFTGSTAHTVNCMIMPVLIYLRVFWKKMSVKAVSMLVMIVCGSVVCYVMIHAGKQLFTPSDDGTAFPYCDVEYQDEPYYVYNNTN
ncbi:hypothetical protein PRNP1_007975 [Phytophthora ramorum]